MKAGNPNSLFVGLITVTIIIAVVSGCDRQSRHKMLTVFFTGVPPLAEEKKGETEKDKTILEEFSLYRDFGTVEKLK